MTQSQFVCFRNIKQASKQASNQPTQPNQPTNQSTNQPINQPNSTLLMFHPSDLLIGQDTMMLDGTPGPYPVTASTRNHSMGATKPLVPLDWEAIGKLATVKTKRNQWIHRYYTLYQRHKLFVCVGQIYIYI